MKELTLQIKPVGNHCNLCCKYCYAAPFKSKTIKTLDLNLLDKLIKESFEITDRVIVTWHGGEPTLVGVEYFEKYLKIIKKYKKENQKIYNMIQTNATLITDKMAKFFKKNKFIVSISLDGDEKAHNKNRVDASLKGSFHDAFKGLKNLRKNGINPPVIVTVTKDNLKKDIENFNFLINNGFKEIKYSPVYDSIKDNFSISNEDWFGYLKNILYRWIELKDETIKVREIDEILSWFAGKQLTICSNSGTCSRWISIDEFGNIYPCEYMRDNNMYGNIHENSLKEVFQSDKYKLFVEKITYYYNECKNCKLFSFCHNGCPATRINKNNKLSYKGKYVYCLQRKRLHQEIEKILN